MIMGYFVDKALSYIDAKDGNYLAIYSGGNLRYLINNEKGNSFFAKQKLSNKTNQERKCFC